MNGTDVHLKIYAYHGAVDYNGGILDRPSGIVEWGKMVKTQSYFAQIISVWSLWLYKHGSLVIPCASSLCFS